MKKEGTLAGFASGRQPTCKAHSVLCHPVCKCNIHHAPTWHNPVVGEWIRLEGERGLSWMEIGGGGEGGWV